MDLSTWRKKKQNKKTGDKEYFTLYSLLTLTLQTLCAMAWNAYSEFLVNGTFFSEQSSKCLKWTLKGRKKNQVLIFAVSESLIFTFEFAMGRAKVEVNVQVKKIYLNVLDTHAIHVDFMYLSNFFLLFILKKKKF